jgi:hypothetical protein
MTTARQDQQALPAPPTPAFTLFTAARILAAHRLLCLRHSGNAALIKTDRQGVELFLRTGFRICVNFLRIRIRIQHFKMNKKEFNYALFGLLC